MKIFGESIWGNALGAKLYWNIFGEFRREVLWGRFGRKNLEGTILGVMSLGGRDFSTWGVSCCETVFLDVAGSTKL